MAIQKINFDNKVSTITSPLPAINRIRDVDVNEIKSVVNNNADELEAAQEDITDLSTITTGTGTINTSYVASAEYNHWERVGNIVTYSFTITTTGTWSTTTAFVSGLPKPKATIRFTAINHSYAQPFRAQLNTNGTLQNAYSTTTPASRKTN